MKYKELEEPCKSAIAAEKCLGCSKLELENFIPPKKCPYIATAEDYIKQIKMNLGAQEKIWK